jgi:phosphoglycolate phosphatase-like HAD superfamily hydrolase
MRNLILLTISAGLGAAVPTGIETTSINPLNCSTFNATNIRLITFDVFAALMDTPTSLLTNVGAALPALSAAEVESFVNDWLDAYGLWFGKTFPANALPQPFPWVISDGLSAILAARNLSSSVPQGSPTWNALMTSWSRLTPWDGVADTLAKLQKHGFRVAALSNGDTDTLRNATSIFAQHQPPVYMDEGPFSSDWPLGAFKPLPQIYYQALPYVNGNNASYLHVAGSPIDAWGARSAGLFAALSNGEPPMAGLQPCFLLANLTMLPAVLGIRD